MVASALVAAKPKKLRRDGCTSPARWTGDNFGTLSGGFEGTTPLFQRVQITQPVRTFGPQ